jgi:uncharacterized protein YjbJ (UPF0337 family)
MNAEQLKGKWLQFKGELKEKYGKFIDDELKQIEGNCEKFVGKFQERYGDQKDALMKWMNQGMRSRRRNPWGGVIALLNGRNSRKISDDTH